MITRDDLIHESEEGLRKHLEETLMEVAFQRKGSMTFEDMKTAILKHCAPYIPFTDATGREVIGFDVKPGPNKWSVNIIPIYAPMITLTIEIPNDKG